MIDDTQLEQWKTKAEATEILKCSEKTISRLADQKRIQKLMQRNLSRRTQRVFNPDDFEAIRSDQDQIEAFRLPAERSTPGAGTSASGHSRLHGRGGGLTVGRSTLTQPLVCLWSGKVLLNLKQAAKYSGMPK